MIRKTVEFNFRQVAFRPRFWVVFYTIFALDLFFGIVLTLVSIGKMARPDLVLPSSLWAMLALFGLSFLISAFFCGELLVSIAQLLRYTRNQEVRARTVIGSRNINEYSMNEAERNSTLLRTVEDKYQEMGNILTERIEKNNQSAEMRLNQMQMSISRFIERFDQNSETTKNILDRNFKELKEAARAYGKEAETFRSDSAAKPERKAEAASADEDDYEFPDYPPAEDSEPVVDVKGADMFTDIVTNLSDEDDPGF